MEGDSGLLNPACNAAISIHSLRMEGDLVKLIKFWAENISIHSLRMEGDGH